MSNHLEHPSGDPGAAVLRLEAINVVLSGRQVLEDVTFAIGRGELACLIGSNGAGKTTMLKVVLGLLAPSSGRVLVEGQRLSRRSSLVGYVPQKVHFDPDLPLRARDVVGLGVDGHRLGLARSTRQRARRVAAMLEAVDATRFADERVGNLSGGEQQRVLIAHALVGNPRLLLLDEPLANLDLKSEQEVVALLSRIAREQAIAVVLSAHDMNPLLGVMDRIIYVASGRVASGTTEEVVRPEVLSKLYGHHVDVLKVHDRIVVVAGATTTGGPEEPTLLHGSVASLS